MHTPGTGPAIRHRFVLALNDQGFPLITITIRDTDGVFWITAATYQHDGSVHSAAIYDSDKLVKWLRGVADSVELYAKDR